MSQINYEKISIREYYEAQLIISESSGIVTITTSFNNSPYTFSGVVASSTRIVISPSAAITTILPICSTATTLGAAIILCSPYQTGSDIRIEHTATATGIDNIQLNLKMII